MPRPLVIDLDEPEAAPPEMPRRQTGASLLAALGEWIRDNRGAIGWEADGDLRIVADLLGELADYYRDRATLPADFEVFDAWRAERC